jgi:hypothetical protein
VPTKKKSKFGSNFDFNNSWIRAICGLSSSLFETSKNFKVLGKMPQIVLIKLFPASSSFKFGGSFLKFRFVTQLFFKNIFFRFSNPEKSGSSRRKFCPKSKDFTLGASHSCLKQARLQCLTEKTRKPIN